MNLRYRATNVAPPPSDPFNPLNPFYPCSPERGSPPLRANPSRVPWPGSGRPTREPDASTKYLVTAGNSARGGLPRSGEHGFNELNGLNGSLGGGATFVAR